MNSAARWRFAPYFMVRQCGFAFAHLEMLRDPDVSAAIVAVAIADAEVSRQRRTVLDALRPVAGSDRNHQRVSKYKPIDADSVTSASSEDSGAAAWNHALDRSRESRDGYLSAYRRCLSRYATEVPALFYGQPALMDAVLLSNQASYRTVIDSLEHIDTANPGRRDRRRLDLLIMYLQRFCSKNDTNAHFGPFGVGTIAAAEGNLHHEPVPGITRHTFTSHWAADAIVAAAAAEGGEIVCYPRVAPGVLRLKDGIFILRYAFAPTWTVDMTGPVNVGLFEQSLLELCDGSRTVADIVTATVEAAVDTAAYGRNTPAMDRGVREALTDLVGRGVVDADVNVTIGVSYPLDEVASRLATEVGNDETSAARTADSPARRWSTRVAEFAAAVEEFGAASTPAERVAAFDATNATFEEITGASAHRRGGVLYADRSVLYEECMREDTITIGGELLSSLDE